MQNKKDYFDANNAWFSDKDTELVLTCLICKKPVSLYDNKFSTSEEIAKCSFCGFVFRRDQPTQVVLDKFYWKSEPMKKWSAIKETEEESIRQSSKYQGIIEVIKQKNIQSIMDFGCGNGFFLKMLPDSIKRIGLEPNIDAKGFVDTKIELIGNTEELNTKVDMISLFGVLEHLKNPHEEIVKLKQHLNPGGYFSIIVPNIESLVITVLREKTSTFCPQHLWYFSIDSLTDFFREHGFSLIYFKTIEAEEQPILRTLHREDPYGKTMFSDNNFSNIIIGNDSGYKIVAIFEKNVRLKSLAF